MKNNFKKNSNENIDNNVEANKKFDNTVNPLDELMDNSTFMSKLKKSDRACANWRKNGLIPYVKLGGRIYYKNKDVAEFIERGVVKKDNLQRKIFD